MALWNLWNYYRDRIDGVDDNASDGKSFKHKIKIVGKIPKRLSQLEHPGDANQLPQLLVATFNVEATIPLKYLSKFWRFLDLHW